MTASKPSAKAMQDICDSKPNKANAANPARSPLPSSCQRKPISQSASTTKGTSASGINWLVYQEIPVNNPNPAQQAAVARGPAGRQWQRSTRRMTHKVNSACASTGPQKDRQPKEVAHRKCL